MRASCRRKDKELAMDKRALDVEATQPVDDYSAPELIVHGTVAELTAGGTGPQKEVGAVGSFLPDDGAGG
jgi:hypothetical protein